MSLENKLEEIIFYYYGYDFDVEDISDGITTIIDAFKAEGWDYSQEKKIQNVGFEYITNAPFKPVVKKFIEAHGYMTGAEWYERFDKELESQHNGMPWTSLEYKVIEAAERASGLTEENT